MSGTDVVPAILLMAAIIFFTRALPFFFFRNTKTPEILNYLERSIPPLIMVLLVLYCMKDVEWVRTPYGTPELVAIAIVITVHLWGNNALLSIVSGTVAYMFAVRTWGAF
jgi:branched-subunit amino acid transport protein AzlD